MRNGENKRLMTVAETAKFLSISSRTIYNQICKKAKVRFPIAPIRIGKSIRFDVEDLKRYINMKKTES